MRATSSVRTKRTNKQKTDKQLSHSWLQQFEASECAPERLAQGFLIYWQPALGNAPNLG
jgi:hypothetical protein